MAYSMSNRYSLLVPFVGLLAGCQADVTTLNDTMAPLRDRFNADKHRPRILALFSPV
ncbi:MAG: hypothetical protein AABZ08_11975 [Planctomycetota bacterium]